MKAVIIKELRENAKWALLLCLAVAGALAWGLNTNDAETSSLVGSTMSMITAIAFPVVGLTLGLLQVLQDSSPGRWGFLTHRPISRSRIFIAKCLAGAGFYLLATGIPLTAAVYWAATPGRLAVPFDWHMILPRLADLLGGSMWYAAALLVGARQAHWIGTRVFPGCVALIGSSCAAFLPMSIAQSLLIFAIVLAILIPAAWGTFISGGSFERQPLVTRIPTALSVGVGVVCVLGACAGISVAMLDTLAAPPPASQVFTSYEIADNGQVLKVSIDRDSSLKPNRVTDLQGRALPAELTKNRHVLAAAELRDRNPANMPWRMRLLYWGLQEEGSNLIELGAAGSVQWYYVVHRRTIEGFDRIHRQFIGSLGPHGFIPPAQPPKPFFEPLYILDQQLILNSPVIVAAGAKTAYSINLADETVVPLFSTDPADPILNLHASVTTAFGDTAREPSPFVPYVPIIVTQAAIHVFERGGERFRLPLNHPSPEAMHVGVCKLSGGGFGLVYQTLRWDRGIWGWAVKTDPRGRIISESELPLPPINVEAEAWWLQTPKLLIYPPIAAPVKLWLDSKSSGGFHLHEPVAAGVIMLIAIVAANRLLRRVGLSRPAKGFWVLLSALLGFSGVLLLLSLFNRVATVPCPSCGKRRLVTRERCEHCNAPFEAPSAGIEILE